MAGDCYARGMSRFEDVSPFLSLAQAISELVFVWNPEGRMLWVNESFKRTTGLQIEDFAFRNVDNPFIHPDDLTRVVTILAEFVASDAIRVGPFENRFVDAWGRTHIVRSEVTKILWDGEAALLFVASTSGGTLQSETDLRYRILVESSDDGILQVDAGGRILFSNRRFQAMTGKAPSEIAKSELADFFVESERPRIRAFLDHVVVQAEGSTLESRMVDAHGATTWVTVTASGLEDFDDMEAFLVVLHDIAEARRLEESVRQARKLESLAILAGGIAHDFNNIMTGVLANAAFAEASIADGESPEAWTTMGELLGEIRQSAERAARLNALLLTYIGQGQTSRDPIDLHTVVAELRQRIDAMNAPLAVSFDVPPQPVSIRGDAVQLLQLLVQLVANAVEAIGSGPGHIRFRVDPVVTPTVEEAPQGWLPSPPPPHGLFARIVVQDTGPGIASEVLDRVFDPFFSTKGTGRGLGLSEVLGIVRNHHGFIRLDSEPQRGTTVEVYLPLATLTSPQLADAANVSATQEEHRGVVLVVDDEATIRRIARRTLERAGYAVTTAENGEEALLRFNEAPSTYVAALVDHCMPGMRGDELAIHLRAIRPQLPIVHTFGFRDNCEAVTDDACTMSLPKPFRPDQLLAAIRSLSSGSPQDHSTG